MLPTRNYVGIDTGTTIRPASTALLTIDSEDRYADKTAARLGGVSPYDFSIELPASLMNGFFTRLAVSEVVFPWVIPNIGPKTNKIIVQWTPAVGPNDSDIITIPDGFYTPAQLAAEMQAAVRLVSPDLAAFTMTYGSPALALGSVNFPVFEYSVAAGPAVAVAFFPMTPLSPGYAYGPQARQLFDVLGFSTAVNSTLRSDAAGGPTFAQGSRYVDIVCQQLANNQSLKDASSQKTYRDALCRLYIIDPANIQSTTLPSSATFCPPGCAATTIYKNFTLPKQIQWLPNQPIVGSLRFQVYDDEGDILTLSQPPASTPGYATETPATNWSMSLLISEN